MSKLKTHSRDNLEQENKLEHLGSHPSIQLETFSPVQMMAHTDVKMGLTGRAQSNKVLQRRIGNQQVGQMAQQPIQLQENNTGLPDQLKAGVENLSGYSMDDVRVHYNSAKPAQLQALAYAQGSEIHLGPGREKHLPHEAWHVMQQKQGRVRPTMQMKGNVQINDDAWLEQEADLMGAKALSNGASAQLHKRINQQAMKTPSNVDGLHSPIQRYVDLDHPQLGQIQMSESHEFFKAVSSDRSLWAKKDHIILAEAIMSLNAESILAISSGQSNNFMGQAYHQVVVSDRKSISRAVTMQNKSSRKAASSAPLKMGAQDPFDIFIDWLSRQKGKTIGQLMKASMEMQCPYAYGTYANGAFTAIRIQQDLNLNNKFDSLGEDTLAPIDELQRFLTNWRGEISKVNSEAVHDFNFMVTECGGFSRMIMAGPDSEQGNAEVGDRMRVNGLGDLPGPWKNHYTAVIMTDPHGDKVSVESAASLDKWWFGMYGSKSVPQTFIAKTLLAKLQIGNARGEDGAAALEQYVQAILDQNPQATQLGNQLDPVDKRQVDELLKQAKEVVEDNKTNEGILSLKKMVPGYELLVEQMPDGENRHKTIAQDSLARGLFFLDQIKKETLKEKKETYYQWAKGYLDKSHQAVIDERINRERSSRYARGGY